MFHHDNGKPHTSLAIWQKLLQLGYFVLPYSPYSPDSAPSDYNLFLFLQKFLDDKIFTSYGDVKNALDQVFAGKDQKLYERGIMLLPERWQKVPDQNEEHRI